MLRKQLSSKRCVQFTQLHPQQLYCFVCENFKIMPFSFDCHCATPQLVRAR
jgi:hypothetical protein